MIVNQNTQIRSIKVITIPHRRSVNPGRDLVREKTRHAIRSGLDPDRNQINHSLGRRGSVKAAKPDTGPGRDRIVTDPRRVLQETITGGLGRTVRIGGGDRGPTAVVRVKDHVDIEAHLFTREFCRLYFYLVLWVSYHATCSRKEQNYKIKDIFLNFAQKILLK